ncbi:MAG TPA: fumarylacetoacetate hydrolase family protein [Burkholderiaceae bacterium]
MPSVQNLSASLARAWRERHTLDASAWSLTDEAEAYAVNDGIVAALNWHAPERPQFWKSGGGARTVRLTHAPLAPDGVRATPADFSDLALRAPGIEAEIALRTRVALNSAEVAALQDPSAVIDAMCVSAELVSSRWQQGSDAPALLRMADCQSHGALALGEWLPYRARDWSTQACSIELNGVEVMQGVGCHSLNDPAWVLGQWLQHATRHGPLPAGSVVTTGAWLVVKGLQAGDCAEISFAGLGAVRVQL